MHRYAISDHDFERIEPLLPGQPGKLGRNAANNRLFIDAVLWIARTGAPWQDLPERFGIADTVYKRFSRWSKRGIWQEIHHAVQDPDLEWLMLDGSVIRAHQHAAGKKKVMQTPRRSDGVAVDSPLKSMRSSMPSAIPWLFA